MPCDVVIHHYDPVWPELFEREAVRIAAALGPSALAIEHVGSTAVPGLAAKPCIDVVAGVADLERDGEPCVAALLAAGWREVPAEVAALAEQRHLTRPGRAEDAFHLHLVAHGGRFWDDHLLVRDYLRARPRAALAFQQLKHVLVERSADRAAYTEGKGGFIASIIELARADRAAGRL